MSSNYSAQGVAADEKVNILLVDDREDKLLALEACLADLNQNLVKARSGREALRMLLRQSFAVVLLDVTMPEMSGFDTAEMIRNRPGSEHIPIIFMTSHSENREHITKGYFLGAVDFIFSPIIPEILKAKVSAFVELYKKNKQIHDLNRELEMRIGQLTEINQELEAFAFTISHDLRAPLRAMKGLTRALSEDYQGRFDETARDYIRRIVSASEEMDRLVEDLLVYSRLQSEELPMQWVDVEALLQKVLSQLDEEINRRCALVQWNPPLPQVWGNPVLVEQILTNLLTNALKFVKPNRRPEIKISVRQGKTKIRYVIADNGIGIDPHQKEKIFQVFTRLHRSKSYPGTGLGLAIVRKGMNRMKGRVGVTSGPGQGSRFWLDFPLNAEKK
jgi:signal transduction histidine kinase